MATTPLASSSSSSSAHLLLLHRRGLSTTTSHLAPACSLSKTRFPTLSIYQSPNRIVNNAPRHRPIRASLATETVEDEAAPSLTPEEVEQSVSLLKTAAKTRKVPPTEVYAAMRVLEKAKIDPSDFFQTIGGTESPGRTWMLVFTSSTKLVRESLKGGPGGGQYLPVTAVQRFDAAAMRIENGIYLGSIGYLTFEGRISWKKRILAFLFENLNIKIGSLGPFKFNIERKDDKGRTPSTKDPFFMWFYADEEIIVAKGRGGGVAFWCRCTRVSE